MDKDIAEWQRGGPLFNCYDDPEKPGDRLCVESHNVYHRDRMAQVGPYFLHQNIFTSHFYPPKPEDYEAASPVLGRGPTLLLILGCLLAGVGLGLLLPI